MKILKFAFCLICLLILASNILMMSRWTEARGVNDDLCYLRQAHLFQRFGLGGLDTDISRNDDHFMERKLKEINYPDVNAPPCHTSQPSGKLVLQYPPGTGFLLALFPEGHQVAPLYVIANLIVCSLALFGIFLAESLPAALCAGLFGALVNYLMINPAKASYSIAPTMVICAMTGYLTALWLTRRERDLRPVILIGLLLGLSVNLRLPNLFLVAGYVLYLGITFLQLRNGATFVRGLVFGVAFVAGMAPTLIANAINAGSPVATTYGAGDVAPPEFNIEVLGQYLGDTQLVLIVLAIGSTAWLLRMGKGGARHVALVVAGNLLVNLIFFLSHPVFTPYYVVPIAMLSLWSVSFGLLMQSEEAAKRVPPAQMARAGRAA
ncbi:hypothetical protein I3J27_08435 [Bradyrhizobium xenonodulans]|uniref:Glycosyltransferase RgtA/B/C/D-like domain-containing protein n=1 Tax=Bradyrhizobium xenonodulans TaxID=2736875 RepID=A0ABY7MUZ6_9BRAD|nr:hypothetical protein [Bradyrhizobium xenonodulans]WBL80432.1 hypothetical protein I3J27_08435 [Bradyrhizobium xenonodulans]